MLDKIVSDYETIYGGQLDEDALLSRCTNTVSCLEKLMKDIGGGINSGNFLTIFFFLECHNQVINYSYVFSMVWLAGIHRNFGEYLDKLVIVLVS